MANKRVRILDHHAAAAWGVDGKEGQVVSVDEQVAARLVQGGFAENVRTETAAKKPSKAKKSK